MAWIELVTSFLFKILLLLGVIVGILVMIAVIVGLIRWIFTGDFEGY